MNGAKQEKTNPFIEMFDLFTQRIRESGNRVRPPPPSKT
jgi:hypothetical protein